MGVDKTVASKKTPFLCFVLNWLEQNSLASTDTWLTGPKEGVFQDFFNSHFFHTSFHQFQDSCFFFFFAFQYLANLDAIYNECCCCCFLTKSCLILWDSQKLEPARLLWSWDFPGKNTGMGCHFLLHGIFLTQGHLGSPYKEWWGIIYFVAFVSFLSGNTHIHIHAHQQQTR